MINVAILATENASLSSVAMPTDILHGANVLWNTFFNEKADPKFSVKVVTSDGKPVRTEGSIAITPDCGLKDLVDVDLVIVCPGPDIAASFEPYASMLAFMVDAYESGTHIASICTGAFLLAETGLLDNRLATTHWAVADQFRKRYPKVLLKSQEIVTEQDNLFCSGGGNAGADLALYLVRKYCGNLIANRCARMFVMDPNRISQVPYEVYQFNKNHGDSKVASVQAWIESHFNKDLHVNSMADEFGMSRKTFERKFKNATGISPLAYLQRVRVERAKTLLEMNSDTFEQVTYEVGYTDTSSFRRVFLKHAGLSPSKYREKYKQIH